MRQASNLGEELDEGNWGDFYFVFLVHLPHFLRGSFLELSDKVQYLCPKYSSPRLFTEIVGLQVACVANDCFAGPTDAFQHRLWRDLQVDLGNGDVADLQIMSTCD
jgi:hypothetical protein